jgi:hypothetical protein
MLPLPVDIKKDAVKVDTNFLLVGNTIFSMVDAQSSFTDAVPVHEYQTLATADEQAEAHSTD